MSTYQQIVRVRTRKLGLLIHDARISRNRSIESCAKAMGISIDEYQSVENGIYAPSLPQLETLAFFLDVPLEHFWGNQTLSSQSGAEPEEQPRQILELRQKIIGAALRMARKNVNLSTSDLAISTSIPEERINQYELGEMPVSLPDLEILANSLQIRIEELFDTRGLVGKWRMEKLAIQNYLDLPEEVRDFVSKPINLPYLQLAMRLNDLSVEKLRAVAEGLLEITY